jgi:predicted nucleotidyltransferase
MRIYPENAEFIKKAVKSYLPDAEVYLFGSRTKDNLKGGDFDVLVLSGRELNNQEKREIKISFYKKFGEQKIDIVSFERNDPAPFKQLALLEAQRL